MDKRSIFERGFAILLSVILMAACFPLSIFAEDTTQGPDFSGTNLMNLENVQPSGYTTTTNPYGYDVGMPFLMVEQNELMYLNVWVRNPLCRPSQERKAVPTARFPLTPTP